MKAIDYLKMLRDAGFGGLPSREGRFNMHPSNSELRRWLTKGSVRINGTTPKPGEEVTFPIHELILFPGAPSQATII